MVVVAVHPDPVRELDLRLGDPVGPLDTVGTARLRRRACSCTSPRTQRAACRRSLPARPAVGVVVGQEATTGCRRSRSRRRDSRPPAHSSTGCRGRSTRSSARTPSWRPHSPGGLNALNRSKLLAVPPGAYVGEWSSPLITTAAFLPRGRYQKCGSGSLSRSIKVIRFTNSRCCSSACGIAILLVSSQSGCTSPALAPKNMSSGRTPTTPSRSCPAQAGFPCRVYTTERARSNVNAAA